MINMELLKLVLVPAVVKIVSGFVVGYPGRQNSQGKVISSVVVIVPRRISCVDLLCLTLRPVLFYIIYYILYSRFPEDACNTQPFIHPDRCLRRCLGPQPVRLPALYVQETQQCVAWEILLSVRVGFCG